MNNDQYSNNHVVSDNNGKTASLSSNGQDEQVALTSHSAERNNERLAQAKEQMANAPSGKRAEDYKNDSMRSLQNSANNGSLKNNQPYNKPSSSGNLPNKNGANDLKKNAAQEALKNGASSFGVPKKATQSAMDSKLGQALMNRALNKSNPLSSAINKISNRGDDNTQKPDSEKTTEEKSDEKTKRDIGNGEMSFAMSLKLIKWLVIIAPPVMMVLIFVVIIMASINEQRTSTLIMAGLLTSSEEEMVDYIGKEMDESSGTGLAANVGTGTGLGFPQDYYNRLATLGNNFSSESNCTDSDECMERSEFLYYLKVADISLRYKHKYGVNLDWFLIVATDIYFDKTEEEIMEANLSNYDKDAVEDYDSLSELDWDNDFTNIPGYRYLDADDSRYDLNILAKNMVKKTTTQTCGNTVQVDEDVEDEYLGPGGEKHLNCSSGNYSISSTYELDLDKYDEFMLEYIDKKIYTPGSKSGHIRGNNLAEAMVNLAVEQLKDSSASGGGKYKEFMGWGRNSGSAWCAAFVSWVIANTEYNNQKLNEVVPIKDGWVGAFAHWGYENKKWYWNDNSSKYAGRNGSGKYTPKPGDLIFIDWECNWSGRMPTVSGDRLDHIGIVQRVEDGKIITIEGNRGGGLGKVKEDQYYINSCQVAGFVSWYD